MSRSRRRGAGRRCRGGRRRSPTDCGADAARAAELPSYAEQLARDVAGARVVQAFNTLPSRVLELPRERLAAHRISLFACSDDDEAKRTVIRLGEELGLVGVDGGELVRARIIDGVVDCIRFQIARMGRSPLTAISLHTLVEEA